MDPSPPSVALRALRLIETYPLHLPFLVWLVILTCATAAAQKDTGAIAGLVKDSSGAVVSGAEVTITDADRGTSLVLKTNAQGEYVASPLKIGRYKVTVEKAGFKKAVAGPIVVNVPERPEIDVTSSEMPVETLFAGQASRTGISRSLRFPLSLRRGD